MTEKLHCWPGCLAEFVSGPSKGKRVIVVARADPDVEARWGNGPRWRISSFAPLVIIYMNGTWSRGFPGVRSTALDSRLRPIDPIPDPESITTDEEVPA